MRRLRRLALVLALAGCAAVDPDENGDAGSGDAGSAALASTSTRPPTSPPTTAPPPELPRGGRSIFPAHRVVAFYGTARTGVLGVLGEGAPDAAAARLEQAAAPFATPDRAVQPAFELIVTIADAKPGEDGSYSHDIDPALVDEYLAAARRAKALVILDVQPGRSDFLTEVSKYERFLREPDVGVALDSEWRMGPQEVPGRVIGQVSAAEVNQVSAYLARLVEEENLPEKILLLHTFEASMLPDVDLIEARPGIAIVQHLDGFGSQRVKIEKYDALKRPDKFRLGFKLFYDEDVGLFTPAEVVTELAPPPDFVSYQ